MLSACTNYQPHTVLAIAQRLIWKKILYSFRTTSISISATHTNTPTQTQQTHTHIYTHILIRLCSSLKRAWLTRETVIVWEVQQVRRLRGILRSWKHNQLTNKILNHIRRIVHPTSSRILLFSVLPRLSTFVFLH